MKVYYKQEDAIETDATSVNEAIEQWLHSNSNEGVYGYMIENWLFDVNVEVDGVVNKYRINYKRGIEVKRLG